MEWNSNPLPTTFLMSNGVRIQYPLLFYSVMEFESIAHFFSNEQWKLDPLHITFYFLIIYGVCKKRKYCNRMSEKKKISPFDKCLWFLCLRRQNKQKKISACPSVRPFVCLSVCLSVCLYVRAWTFPVDTITFEGVSGSKQNVVGVFHVWNVGLVLKSKVISWFWSWSWF